MLVCPLAPQDLPQKPTFSSTTNLVVVNITVVSRDGKPVENLTRDDFLLFEDGKLQQLQSAEFEHLNSSLLPPVQVAEAKPAAPVLRSRPPAEAAAAKGDTDLHDRRLIVMLFDFSSMQPPEQIRAVNAALQFLNTK